MSTKELSYSQDNDASKSQNRFAQTSSLPQTPLFYSFSLHATTPPPTNPDSIMQRADEVNALQRMMSDPQASAIMLIGDSGTGKSTLAALLFRRLQLARDTGKPAPRYLVWISLGMFTTLPDMIASILSQVEINDPGFFLLKPEQQVSSLLRALRRPQMDTLIVLDQFESLLQPETSQASAGRGVLSLFLDMLQTDLGSSRIILTGYNSPYSEDLPETRVHSCLVTQIALPEGLALLQQRKVQGNPEDLSLAWQRSNGHVFSLVLLSALVHFSNIPLGTLLNSPQFQPLWDGDVITHLIASIYHYLNPIQYSLMRALSLFYEPVPLEGIITAVTGDRRMGMDSLGRAYVAFERELELLCSLSLVQKFPNSADVVYYTLHSLLRQYIHEHYLEGSERRKSESLASLGVSIPQPSIPDSAEAQQVARAAGHMQIAAYYQQLAQEQCPPRDQRQGLPDIEPLISAVRHLCLGWRWQEGCDLLFTEKLHERMVQWGAWNTLINIYTAMIPPLGTLNPRDEGLVLGYVGMLYGRLGEQAQSSSFFDQALALQRKANDQRGEVTTLVNVGELLRSRNEHEQARTYFEQALRLNQQVQDSFLQCIALHNLGLIFHASKEYAQAFDCYQESLKLVQFLPNKQYRGMILTNLGMVLYEQGMLIEGLAILLAALRIRQMLQDPTAVMLELFLRALEQKLGSEAYQQVYQNALENQQQVFQRYVPIDPQS
ncbi:MAG TPA: tetratricopeptide repeat protein [Ktedonobacteraceae bacterium]|nr:tetratricopeptide repeat protein [Ktedonobacteraceae bacterium]